MRLLLFVLVILAVVAPAFGQRPKSRQRKIDLRLVKDKPSIFISYDHYGKREPLKAGESSDGVWLRLHNNTEAAIFLASFGVPKALGQVGMFYDIVGIPHRDDYHDPSVPAVETRTSDLPVGYERGHTSGAYLLRPGSSVSFSVPREHLPDRVGLRITFNYEWEVEGDLEYVRRGEPEHHVIFYSSSLPK
jgi:hypothetical protein